MRFEGSTLTCAGLAILLAAAAAAQTVPGQSDQPDAQSLEKALASLKALVNDRNYRKLGFQDNTEAASATFGTPIRRYLVRPDKLRQFQSGTDPASVLEDTRQWIYPVLVNGMVRCAVTVAFRAGAWSAISYGDQGLARVLFRTRTEDSAELTPRREDLFFLVDIVSANRKFVARRTDGLAPEQRPGQKVLVFTWIGRPAVANQKRQAAEVVLQYLSDLSKQRKGKGPA